MSNIITGRRIFANNDKLQGGPFLPITGGNLTGNLNGVTPTELTYLSGLTSNVQNQINNINAGLSWKDSVRAATTGNITLSGAQMIDGISIIAGDRVLVKDQTDPTENGLYDVSAGAWTRTTDADTGAELLQATVMVEEGTVNADTMWTGIADEPITIGVTALPFIKTSGTTYTSSNGITLTGNNFTLTTGFFSGDATILNGVITIDPNFVSNNLGVTCIPLIQVSTINSCSPLAINPTNLQFVGIGIAIPTAKVHIKGALSDTTHALLVQNQDNALSLQVRNDGSVYNLGGGSIATNTAFGILALLSNTTGARNSAFGHNALNANTTGTDNVAVGQDALRLNTGSYNVAVGYALQALTSGNQNTAVGYGALIAVSAGASNNTAIGSGALQTGGGAASDNTAIGMGSLAANAGSVNTAIGRSSGATAIGSNNVFLGAYAGYYESGNNTLMVSNQGYGDQTTARTNSIIYGIFAATPATQFLTFNANVTVSTLAGTGNRFVLADPTGLLVVGTGTFIPTANIDFTTCITTLNVSTINSCSPLFINPTNAQNIVALGTPGAGQFLIGTTTVNPGALGIVRIGQGTSTVDIGEVSSGIGAIWLNAVTPSTTNYSLKSTGATTKLNAPTGSVQLSVGDANIMTSSGPVTSFSSLITTSGSSKPYTFTSPASTNQTLSTEINGFTYTLTTSRQWATGALALQREFLINAPTYRFVAASTITDAVTFAVNGAPIAGTNATITRSWAARLLGNVAIGGLMHVGDITGTTAPNSTLHIGGSFAAAYRAVTGTYTADITDFTINATSGTFTINLPTAVGITGRQYNIKNSGAGIVTIDAAGTETIDGALTKVLAVQYSSFTLISDGANWGIY